MGSIFYSIQGNMSVLFAEQIISTTCHQPVLRIPYEYVGAHAPSRSIPCLALNHGFRQ